jgi:hypothetical protein
VTRETVSEDGLKSRHERVIGVRVERGYFFSVVFSVYM